eukprot:CAMPEP_0197590376 /NCGR_PEP_ID=MMETSP1326-20131121/10986_1 /TAXON_ID=1155430 /ORGANISM="Genus nov. species nov., Strain RCC2288" /LENGTH=143 /DNA_ID=CAMNT_0043155403 /DNA_START=519 /DNA_END=947 /DNA_ORIENTATION=-
MAACEQVDASHRHPCFRAHFSVSKCPPPAANEQVSASQGQCWLRTHFNAARCPTVARKEQILSFHSHRFAFAQASRSMDRKNLGCTLNGKAALIPATGSPHDATYAAILRDTLCIMTRSVASNRGNTASWKTSEQRSSNKTKM